MKGTAFRLGILACALAGVPAFGAIIIDFGTGAAGNGGTIVQSGSNATGTNILIGSLNYQNGASNTTYTMSGLLSFNTAANTISITGSIPTLGITSPITLLTGSFTSFSVANPISNLIDVSGSGPDTKSATLLTALGLPTTTQFAFFGFSIGGLNLGSTNTYTAVSTDISNSAVPEPTSIILLGTVVFGISGLLRRRTTKA